jgi:hypothetical protein
MTERILYIGIGVVVGLPLGWIGLGLALLLRADSPVDDLRRGGGL